jgi:hypothetical protein
MGAQLAVYSSHGCVSTVTRHRTAAKQEVSIGKQAILEKV